MERLISVSKLCSITLMFFSFVSCKNDYNDNEVERILGNQINEFCTNKSINLKNIKYDTLFRKYKIQHGYQYNLSYYKVHAIDTTIVTCAFFTNDKNVKFIEVKNLNQWKTK